MFSRNLRKSALMLSTGLLTLGLVSVAPQNAFANDLVRSTTTVETPVVGVNTDADADISTTRTTTTTGGEEHQYRSHRATRVNTDGTVNSRSEESSTLRDSDGNIVTRAHARTHTTRPMAANNDEDVYVTEHRSMDEDEDANTTARLRAHGRFND